MDDRIHLKEWPRYDQAYVLGQKFTGRIICQNAGTVSDIKLSFRAIETLEVKSASGVSKNQVILFESIQTANSKAAAVIESDRLEWWFEMKTPKLCSKSYSISSLALETDRRYSQDEPCALPPSLPAKNGASVEYTLKLEVNRTEPHNRRVLECVLPFVRTALPTEINPMSHEVSLVQNGRVRGRSTLESQFRILLPDDPELQIPCRVFDASIHVPHSIGSRRHSPFMISVKHIDDESKHPDESDPPTFKLSQLRIELRGVTTYRYKNSESSIETKTVRGPIKRFDIKPSTELDLPKDGAPVAIGYALDIPSFSRNPTLVPDFETLDILHTHEFKADLFIKDSRLGHFFSISNDQSIPLALSFPEDKIDSCFNDKHEDDVGEADIDKSGERSLELADVTPGAIEPRELQKSATNARKEKQRRGSWQKRFSIPKLSSWRKSSDTLSTLNAGPEETESKV